MVSTPLFPSQCRVRRKHWDCYITAGSSSLTANLLITRKALYSASQLPYDIVNKDVMDAELPNLFFVFRGDKYGFYCSVSESGRELRTAVWRVGVLFWL